MRPVRVLLGPLLGLSVFSCHSPKQNVDLILHHGKVYTVDSAFSMAQAFAVRDGKVVGVGTDEEIDGGYSAPEVVDAGGKAVYPGFIDAHAHFVRYGQSLFTAALYGSTSWEEVVQRVRQ
ncbi:MAG TPA: amidohydrolase family protein, partial [Puia sp.]